jgi:hypothetical protein
MSKFPVSRVCPECGGKEYTSRKPERLVAFTSDRVCKACQTRYSPPAPLWGALLFLLAAPVLGVLGLVLIALLINPFSLVGLASEAALGIFVVLVFIGGMRTLIESAQAGAQTNGPEASKS